MLFNIFKKNHKETKIEEKKPVEVIASDSDFKEVQDSLDNLSDVKNRVNRLAFDNYKELKKLDKSRYILKYKDEYGVIHEIDGSDFSAFSDAMSHNNWTLIFD